MNRRIAVMIGILALAVLLAACGGGDANGDADEAERAGFRLLGLIGLTVHLTGSTPREWKPGITILGIEFRY